MGRAQKLKAARKWSRVLEDARVLEARSAKPPCATCAMTDPEAWIADTGMARKLVEALQGRARFYCHEGLPCGEGGYQPPRRDNGQVDQQQLTPCGGFLRFALTHRQDTLDNQIHTVAVMQRRMLTRWLASDAPLAQEWRAAGFTPGALQVAIQLMDTQEQENVLWPSP